MCIIYKPQTGDQYTALIRAADRGHTAVVEALIKAPAIEINKADVSVLTPPHGVVVDRLHSVTLLVMCDILFSVS